MGSIIPLSFSDFPEDVQLSILSFLHPCELAAFATTSNKYFALCNDERLWFLKCSRRWGSQTQIKKWGGGKIPCSNLFRLLNQYENLIGIWRYSYVESVRYPSHLQMALFEWGSFYITGYRVLPSERGGGGYDVVKKPFLWITATSDGQTLNYLDMKETLFLTEKDLSCENSEKLRDPGLILVNIDLSENRQLSLRENRQYLQFRKISQTGNKLHEDQCDMVYRSRPDGLMAQIIARNVSVSGNPPSKKERRRERQTERRNEQGACRWRSEHFQKILNHSPTLSTPLQGLWKGIDHNISLNLYLVSYYRDNIYCEVVGSCSTHSSIYQTAFTARATAFLESPLSSEEEHTYNTRTHLRPVDRSNRTGKDRATSFEGEYFDVLRIFYASSSYRVYEDSDADGRVWLYANGTFGFGFLRDNYIVDLRPLLKNGRLLDAVSK